nr:hypothetical protein [Ameyamaea chiangmaiensis]
MLRTDLWRTAVVEAPMAEIVARGTVEGLPVHWLPDIGSLRFLADPFGIWRDGRLHVFVEGYDYRNRVGHIDVVTLDERFAVIDRRTVLREAWHLSYPVVIEDAGEIWMLPESFRSGRLRLYRATRFPDAWEAVEAFAFPVAAIDATPVFWDGRWWMFFTPPGDRHERQSVLWAAFAPALTGPWTLHPANPLRIDASSGRPGGTPVVCDGRLMMPMQDCTRTYGGAIRFLGFDHLSPDRVEARVDGGLTPGRWSEPYGDGLHTLSAAGDVTLVDVKRVSRTPMRLLHDLRRRLRG